MSNVIILRPADNSTQGYDYFTREIVIVKNNIQYIEFLESNRCGYVYSSNNVVIKISKEQYDKIKEMLME